MYATVDFTAGDEIQLAYPAGASGTFYCSYITNSGALMTTFGPFAVSPSILVPSPAAAGDTNQVRAISIYGGSSTSVITVQYLDPLTHLDTLLSFTLLSGYTLTYTADGAGWVVIDSNGHRL